MCGNLAERSFYLDNPFDSSQRYDEVLIAPLVSAASCYREVSYPTYGYVIHHDSMVRSKATAGQVLEYISAFECGEKQLSALSPQAEKSSRYWRALYAARAHGLARTVDCLDDEASQRLA